MFSAPTSTAPASRMRVTNRASWRAGALEALTRPPASVTSSAMSNRFFTARRLLPRAAFRDCGKAVVAGIVLADARERGVQHGHGAALAAGDLAGDVCGGAGHGRNTEADSSSTGSA
ncbi:hypothetical protein G6F23_015169 [Rhizopus arrhizus]|nr:hypothetical protein G6F23_015169 [Rhizopus arrhizus]